MGWALCRLFALDPALSKVHPAKGVPHSVLAMVGTQPNKQGARTSGTLKTQLQVLQALARRHKMATLYDK